LDSLRASLPQGELLEFRLESNQRAVLLREGRAVRALEPGAHAYWAKHLRVVTFNVDELVLAAQPEVLSVVPPEWYTELTLGAFDRAVIFVDERPTRYLRPGTHRVWSVSPRVTVRRYVVTDPTPELTDELRALIPAAELLEA